MAVWAGHRRGRSCSTPSAWRCRPSRWWARRPLTSCSARGGGRVSPLPAPASPQRPAPASPGEPDLELGAVVLDHERDLELHLVGNSRDKAEVVALEDDVVAGRQLVGNCAQARRGVLTPDCFLLLQFHEVHRSSIRCSQVSRPRLIRRRARKAAGVLSGTAAEGEAPGCERATRALSTWGWLANVSGGAGTPAPPPGPGLPAGVGPPPYLGAGPLPPGRAR